VDLVFVLASTGILGSDNWNLVKQFASYVVSNMDVSATDVR